LKSAPLIKFFKLQRFRLKRSIFNIIKRNKSSFRFNKRLGNVIYCKKYKPFRRPRKFRYNRRFKKAWFKRAIIHLDSSRCNYFVSLTDLAYKPIHSVTSGKFTQSTTGNKKAKKSSTAIYFLLKYLYIFMKAHRITSVILEVRNRFDPLFHQCFNFLRYKKVHIHKIYLTRKFPHHKGLRKRKLRRI